MTRASTTTLSICCIGFVPLLHAVAQARNDSLPDAPPRIFVFLFQDACFLESLKYHTPALRQVLTRGSLGLLNTKVLQPASDPGVRGWATMGAGNYVGAYDVRHTKRTLLGDLLRKHGVSIRDHCAPSSAAPAALIFGIPHAPNSPRHNGVAIEEFSTRRIGAGPSGQWQDIDSKIAHILRNVDLGDTTLILLSQCSVISQDRLSPILILGKRFQSGVLTSSSTRWPGIVANVDIAPTILHMLNIPLSEARKAGMIGMPIETTAVPRMSGDNPLVYIQHLDRWTASMHPSLSRIYTRFGIIEGLLVLITIGACAVTRQRKRNVHLAGRVLLTTTLLLPLAMIPVGLWKFTSSGVGGESELYLSLALAAACAVTTLIYRQAIAFWVTAGTLTLAVDLALHFSRFSPFAFSLVSGSRFYGMGNEHMALLVACMVLWVGVGSGGSTRTDRLSKGVLCAITAVMLGNSSFGANFGGALTAAAALGTAWVAMSSPRWTWRQTLLVVLLVAVVAGVTALDFTRSAPAQSHIGRTFGMSLQRVDPLLGTIKQKLAMNWKFMLVTPVSLLEIVLMAFLAKCIYRPYPSMKKLFDSRPRLHRTLYGAPVGMVVGFLANDSGIVVLVLMLVVYVPAILGLLIEQEMERTMSVPSGSLVADPSCKENAR